ncbi:MAG: acyltransferase family protein [Nitrospirae bacterium]|nr:acyltransferase family protein [Candidatus Manganitrophaceae bacterium]
MMGSLNLPTLLHRPAVPTSPTLPQRRIGAIDVVRGLLICLITLGHSHILLNDSEFNQRLVLILSKITNLGTPAFTFISGMLLGYFEATASDFRRIQQSYFKRALQLLLFAHLLIAAGTYPLRQESSFASAFLHYWYVTDTLAILFIVVPVLFVKVRPAGRLLIGIACLSLWKLALFFLIGFAPIAFAPTGFAPLLLVREFLFGVNFQGNHLLSDTYPMVPLFGLFLTATVLGNRFGQAVRGGRTEGFVKELKKRIAPLLLLSFLMVGLWAWGKRHPESPLSGILRMVFYPEKLSALLPFYIAIFFLILAYYIQKIEVQGKFGPMERLFALFGRISLFTYVAQYFVVQTFPSLLGWRNSMNLPELLLYLFGAMLLLYAAASVYSRFLKRSRRTDETHAIRVERSLSAKKVSPLYASDLPQPRRDLW